eukprot:jgi/Tetstr1/459309/TSEL_004704.t1
MKLDSVLQQSLVMTRDKKTIEVTKDLFAGLYSVVEELGYDALQQDVDIMWNIIPLPLFYTPEYASVAIAMSYDGNRRQPPFYVNVFGYVEKLWNVDRWFFHSGCSMYNNDGLITLDHTWRIA